MRTETSNLVAAPALRLGLPGPHCQRVSPVGEPIKRERCVPGGNPGVVVAQGVKSAPPAPAPGTHTTTPREQKEGGICVYVRHLDENNGAESDSVEMVGACGTIEALLAGGQKKPRCHVRPEG